MHAFLKNSNNWTPEGGWKICLSSEIQIQCQSCFGNVFFYSYDCFEHYFMCVLKLAVLHFQNIWKAGNLSGKHQMMQNTPSIQQRSFKNKHSSMTIEKNSY